MKLILLTIGMTIASMACLQAAAAAPDTEQKLYRWVDKSGVIHYGDSVPPEYADLDKEILNEHGITLDVVQGKKTPEEIAAAKQQKEAEARKELQHRQDRALLATYLSVDEIVMHRDRRVELFQAQARVTELYLRNLQKRLDKLQDQASHYRPYSDDPDAEAIDPDLADDIADTKAAIERHQQNLKQFKQDEKNIVASFNNDITRFKMLKGIDQTAAQ